jgi:hypothetical protein
MDEPARTEQGLVTRFDTRVVSAVGLLVLLAVAVSVVSVVAPDVARADGFEFVAAAIPAGLWILKELIPEEIAHWNE